MKQLLLAIALIVCASGVVVAYELQAAEQVWSAPETTPAYGVLVLRKVAIESELADLLGTLTNQHPSVVSKRFEWHAIRREMSKMQAIEKSRVSKLSGTVGNLILNKVALEVELNELRNSLSSQHPDVKKTRFELAALEREIEKVLR